MSECYNMENEDDDRTSALNFAKGVMFALGSSLVLGVLAWVVFHG